MTRLIGWLMAISLMVVFVPGVQGNDYYVSNRSPLITTPFVELPVGAVQADGWLSSQLELMAEGLTGNLESLHGDLGPNSGWLGGTGESWEIGPYYLDGLVPLAYILDDPCLIAQSQNWIEWSLNSQEASGYFGPDNNSWWPRMVMMKVFKSYYEATGDSRVIPFMTDYFQYQLNELPGRTLPLPWDRARGGENILTVLWLYNITGDSFLLNLSTELFNQTTNWTNEFHAGTYYSGFPHGVNISMAVKEPLLYYQQSGNTTHRDASIQAVINLRNDYGQPTGMFSGDEEVHSVHADGRSFVRGTELCMVAEYMYSLEHMVRILGDVEYCDLLERIAFNALPATLKPDIKGHQYFQQTNQVWADMKETLPPFQHGVDSIKEALLFGLVPHYKCCMANMHQSWPKFVKSLWMASDDNGLAAIAYAPCQVSAKVGDGTVVTITEDTTYPFEDEVRLTLTMSNAVTFPLKLRIPAWCDNATIDLNGSFYANGTSGTFHEIDRQWSSGDTVTVHLPAEVNVSYGYHDAAVVERGSLVFARDIGENWSLLPGEDPGDEYAYYEVYPTETWNYALAVDSGQSNNGFTMQRNTVASQPFDLAHPPMRLSGYGRHLPSWGTYMECAGIVPSSPVSTSEPLESISLVPYGCTHVRIAGFPWFAEDLGLSAPTFTPSGGVYAAVQSVAISCYDSGATIYYTTDGSEPTDTNGTAIASGDSVTVSSDTTLKARAYKAGEDPSSVTSADYVIDTQAPETPGVPTVGTVDSGSVVLSWATATDDHGAVTYTLYRNGGTVNAGISTASYTDTSVLPCNDYSYAVQAIDTAGNPSAVSGYSSLASVPAAPQDADLDGNGVVDESDLSMMAGNWLLVGCGTVGDLDAGGLVDLGDFSGLAGAWTGPDTEAPTVPVGLTVDGVTQTSVMLSWQAADDNVGVTGYRVFREGGSVGTAGATAYTDSGLTPEVAYEYRVSAFDGSGNESGQSDPVTATTVVNLLQNGSFEDGSSGSLPDHWGGSSSYGEWDDTVGYEGSCSLKVIPGGTYFNQTVSADSSKGYTLGGWMKLAAGSSGSIRLRAAGAFPGSADTSSVSGTEWSYQAVVVDKSVAEYRVDCVTDALSAGTGWFDAVSLAEN